MTTGITMGMSFEEYAAINAVNFSTLKAIDISPLHYLDRLYAPPYESEAMLIGRAVHAGLLTPDAFDVVTYDGPVRRGKVWEAFRAEHEGKQIVTEYEAMTIRSMLEAVRAHGRTGEILEHVDGEVTITWEDSGVPCKGRLDGLRKDGSIVEVKTTRSIHPRAFAREFASRHYHAQLAWYAGGLAMAKGLEDTLPTAPTYVIAIENRPPYDVAVYTVGWDVLEAGQRVIQRWLTAYAACTRLGKWPGVGADVLELRLPDWAVDGGGDDVDLTGLGGLEAAE